jgi:hypothetical protein
MDPANRVVRSDVDAKRLILRMECRGSSAQPSPTTCGPADPPGGFGVARARITLRDSQPPVLGGPQGPLAKAGAVLEGVQAITVTASDEGGGVERLGVLVDGRSAMDETLERDAPSCRTPYFKVVPCASSTTRTLAFDTASVPNGHHAIQIAAYDAAGNRTLSPAVVLTTRNGAVPNGLNASRLANLVASFRSRGRPATERATVDFGGRRVIRGRLTDADDRPIAGARLEVTAQTLRRGTRPRREAIVRTRRDGTFRYLPRPGPSRILRVGYRAFSLDEGPSAVASLKLKVRAGIRLRVRPRKTTSRGRIRFSGRLLGGPGRGGVQVTLYAVGRVGRSRVPVAVLRTGNRGRFRFEYRFVRTFAPFTYWFQARLGSQRTYPYAAASSNRVTVRVTR